MNAWMGTDRGAELKARDFMRQGDELPLCLPMDSVATAARRMAEAGLTCLPVVEDHETRWLEGILTEHDIATQVVAKGKEPTRTFVSSCMNRHVPTCDPDADLGWCRTLLREFAPYVVVIDEFGNCQGLVTSAELERASRAPAKLAHTNGTHRTRLHEPKLTA